MHVQLWGSHVLAPVVCIKTLSNFTAMTRRFRKTFKKFDELQHMHLTESVHQQMLFSKITMGTFLYSLLKRQKRFCFVSLFSVVVSKEWSEVLEDSSPLPEEEQKSWKRRGQEVTKESCYVSFSLSSSYST